MAMDSKQAADAIMRFHRRIASLDHTVGDDGTVRPSLVCPADGCGFHEFVKLDGWVVL